VSEAKSQWRSPKTRCPRNSPRTTSPGGATRRAYSPAGGQWPKGNISNKMQGRCDRFASLLSGAVSPLWHIFLRPRLHGKAHWSFYLCIAELLTGRECSILEWGINCRDNYLVEEHWWCLRRGSSWMCRGYKVPGLPRPNPAREGRIVLSWFILCMILYTHQKGV